MTKNSFTISVGKSFLQRSYLWSALFLMGLTSLVIFFDFSKSLAPLIFIFYILVCGFLFKLMFIHGLAYHLDQKMIAIEHPFIPWRRSALWKNLRNIKYTEVFKNRFYPHGYFHMTLCFKQDEMDELFKIHLSSGLQDVGRILMLIDGLVKDGRVNLSERALEKLNFLMEQCDDAEL